MSDWSQVVDGPIVHVYLGELNRQTRICIGACRRVLELGNRILVGPNFSGEDADELRGQAELAVSCAASLRNLVMDRDSRRGKSELKQLGTERIAWLQQLVGDLELPIISHVTPRHHLQHYDERLDELALESLRRPEQEPTPMGIVDAVLKHRNSWGTHQAPHFYLRTYIAAENTFIVMNDKVNILELLQEARTLLERIRPHVALHTTMMKSSGGFPMAGLPL